MPMVRTMRGSGRSYLSSREAPESEPLPRGRVSREVSVGEDLDSAEYAAQYYQNPEISPSEIRREDSVASTQRRGNVPDPIDRLVDRMIDRLDRHDHRRQCEESRPSFLEIVAMMRTLGTEKFTGGTDPFVAEAWLRRLDRNFSATRCPEEYKRDVAVYYLDRDASDWWETVGQRHGQCYATEYSWAQFRNEFLRKYFPVEARDRMETQYLELTQGDRSV